MVVQPSNSSELTRRVELNIRERNHEMINRQCAHFQPNKSSKKRGRPPFYEAQGYSDPAIVFFCIDLLLVSPFTNIWTPVSMLVSVFIFASALFAYTLKLKASNSGRSNPLFGNVLAFFVLAAVPHRKHDPASAVSVPIVLLDVGK